MDAKRCRTLRDQEKGNEDRLSALPDFILLLILSLLPTRDAIKTSTLSRRWDRLWTSVSTLKFHLPSEQKTLKDFITSVHHTLLLHESQRISKFSIRFYYKEKFASNVDAWIRFAIRKSVKVLHLDFTDRCTYTLGRDVPYAMPRHFFNNETFTKLKLNFCSFKMHGVQLSWKSLRKLSLRQIVLSDDMVNGILAGCPILECLILEQCSSLTFLSIHSAKLKSLTLCNMQNEIKIYASHLLSLTLSGYMHKAEHSIVDLSSLEYAKIDFNFMFFAFGGECEVEYFCRKLRNIIRNVCHVKTLAVCQSCVQVLTACEVYSIQIPILKCKSLTLETSFRKHELIGIASLLQNSPDLENLTIIASNLYGFWCESDLTRKHPVDEQRFWDSQTDAFSSSLHHLRTVRLYSFMSWGVESGCDIMDMSLGKLQKKIARELNLVKFLLTNFTVIERVDFHIKKDQNSKITKLRERIHTVSQAILACPKASSLVEVVFW
ncbi:PREDICTED: putative F-box protein At1g49610 [Ipomoea nil]|uniref:putative F-box protein At1g49610 n=1 Tax=Ipomoea nil TaxID=35883 RepID=UPI0009009FA3|nr:PREDICTED: putative F-box protein At1g49610 [Ipomoea nil]